MPADLKHFARITKQAPEPHLQNAVVMGRKTWESIPPKFRPLAGRTNVVLTKSSSHQDYPEGVLVAASWHEALDQLEAMDNVGDVIVMGGAQIYRQILPYVDKVYYTQLTLPEDTKFDAFFPSLNDWNVQRFDQENGSVDGTTEHGVTYQFLEYTRPHDELQYLHLCRQILDEGITRGDRTGTGTLSIFGAQMRFSLRRNQLPLLTTKRTFWRGVAEELLWFIRGNTNANDLAAKDIHIWDGNGSKEFLEGRGLGHREEGDLGPVYGFQWRHFGAKYTDMHADYTGQGVDQLAECIHKIIHNPEDRRIVMSAWNPSDLHEMALPPCHMFCQFYVNTESNELSCHMYQRSADMGLGVPFNIASYALLTHLVAHVTGLKPGEFVHTIGDAHVYLNHVEALEEQLQRTPREFPQLRIHKTTNDIDSFEFGDFELIGYNPHKTIKMKMAV